MSKLESYDSERIYWAVEQVEQEAGDIDTLHLDDSSFYLKSEADKVIEKKDKKIDLYKRGWEESDKINASIYAELRHQKYKRCLAMAEMCNARYDEEDAKVNGCGASWEYESKEMKYWERWQNRWLTIAEKFKEDGK